MTFLKEKIPEELAAYLRGHIAAKYRTQKAAAKAYGISGAAVSKILNGGMLPTTAMCADAGIFVRRSIQWGRLNGHV